MGMDIVILSEISQTQKTNVACSLSNVDPKSQVICVLGAYLCVFVGHKSARDYEGRKRS